VRVSVAAVLPPAKKGAAARRLPLVTRTYAVKKGAARGRIRQAAGPTATRLLSRVRSGKASTLEVTISFTDPLGAQTAARLTVALKR
jgi:hypothetical protein